MTGEKDERKRKKLEDNSTKTIAYQETNKKKKEIRKHEKRKKYVTKEIFF